MRILHVINGLGPGGAERLVVELARLAAADGHDVTVATLGPPPPDSTPHLRAQEVAVTVRQMGRHRFDPVGWLRVLWAMRSADLTHAHLFPAIWVAALGPGVKVLTEHSPANRRRDSMWMRWLDHQLLGRFSTAVAISEGVADGFRDYLLAAGTRLPVLTIENGVPLEIFATPAPSTRPGRQLKLLSVGTLDRRKDVGQALAAVRGLDDVSLTIVGDGPERAGLMDRARAEGQQQQVSFLGRRTDVARLMGEHDALVMTSRYEGFGLVAVEAMAAHLPVLAPDLAGLSTVIGPGGLLHPPGDLDSLRRDVVLLRDDEVHRARLASQAHQQSLTYSVDRTHRAHMDLYTTLLGQRGQT